MPPPTIQVELTDCSALAGAARRGPGPGTAVENDCKGGQAGVRVAAWMEGDESDEDADEATQASSR